MAIHEIEAEALRLNPSDRARLAERLLDSLETLSDEENARLWADEAATAGSGLGRERQRRPLRVGDIPWRPLKSRGRCADNQGSTQPRQRQTSYRGSPAGAGIPRRVTT